MFCTVLYVLFGLAQFGEKMKLNTNDIEKHYDLLDHGGQTEIRIFSSMGKSYFVDNRKEFADTVKILNRKEGVHCGTNQRKDYGKKNEDVIMLNGFYFDIEGRTHELKSKTDSYILALRLYNHLTDKKLRPILADSGGGYHLHISLSSPIKVDYKTRPKIERGMKRIKHNYRKVRSEESKVDITDVSLCKLERIIGTYNHRHGICSGWITRLVKTPTHRFMQWVNQLKDPPKRKKVKSDVSENPFECMLLEYSLSNKLPDGERNQVVCPNFMAVNPTREQVKMFSKVQNMNIGEVEGWKKCKSWKGEFNCPQLKSYAKRNDLFYLCRFCMSGKKKRNNIIIDKTKKQASYKQPRERLILT